MPHDRRAYRRAVGLHALGGRTATISNAEADELLAEVRSIRAVLDALDPEDESPETRAFLDGIEERLDEIEARARQERRQHTRARDT